MASSAGLPPMILSLGLFLFTLIPHRETSPAENRNTLEDIDDIDDIDFNESLAKVFTVTSFMEEEALEAELLFLPPLKRVVDDDDDDESYFPLLPLPPPPPQVFNLSLM